MIRNYFAIATTASAAESYKTPLRDLKSVIKFFLYPLQFVYDFQLLLFCSFPFRSSFKFKRDRKRRRNFLFFQSSLTWRRHAVKCFFDGYQMSIKMHRVAKSLLWCNSGSFVDFLKWIFLFFLCCCLSFFYERVNSGAALEIRFLMPKSICCLQFSDFESFCANS